LPNQILRYFYAYQSFANIPPTFHDSNTKTPLQRTKKPITYAKTPLQRAKTVGSKRNDASKSKDDAYFSIFLFFICFVSIIF